jgi:hypothetical protein
VQCRQVQLEAGVYIRSSDGNRQTFFVRILSTVEDSSGYVAVDVDVLSRGVGIGVLVLEVCGAA